MGEFKQTEKFLRTYGNQVEQEIENRLSKHGKFASGKLIDSIRYEVLESNAGFIVRWFYEKYGDFVDKGVNGYAQNRGSKFSFKNKDGKGSGKSEFIKSLKAWCRIKGLPEGAAFPIRRNIWKYGIAPTQAITIPTTRRRKQLEEGIEKYMKADVEKSLQDLIKAEQKKKRA